MSEDFESLKKSGLDIEDKEVCKIVTYVHLLGRRYEYTDLLETVEAISGSDIVINNSNMVSMLKQYGVIESEGNQRWLSGATKGPNYDAFLQMLYSVEK
jgi:hypothetical protein